MAAAHEKRSPARSRAAAPSRARSVASVSNRPIAARSAAASPGGTSRPVRSCSTASSRPPDSGRHDRPSVRHRLAGHDSVALSPRRTDDDGSPLVVRPELGRRHEADGVGYEAPERPVADDHARDALRGPRQLRDPLFRRQPTDEQHVRWIRRLDERFGQVDAACDHPDVGGTDSRKRLRHARVTARRPRGPAEGAVGRAPAHGPQARCRFPTPGARTASP